ncbi:unnamed protein product, partial [Didymodactylos carnosus]
MQQLLLTVTVKTDCQQLPITSVRYERLQCPNYDLCQACYSEKEIHNEHSMAAIRQPCQ